MNLPPAFELSPPVVLRGENSRREPAASALPAPGKRVDLARGRYIAVREARCPPDCSWYGTVQGIIASGTLAFYGLVARIADFSTSTMISSVVEYAQCRTRRLTQS